MKRRRKMKPVPWVAPTPLEGTDMIDGLKKLSTEDLQAEMLAASTVEGWLNTQASGAPEADPAHGILMQAAGHSRVTREVIALVLVQRWDKEKGGPAKPGGYL